MSERKLVRGKRSTDANVNDASVDAPAYSAPSLGHLKRTKRTYFVHF